MLTDSFPAFAKKVLQALDGVEKADELKFLQDRDIRFNLALVNKGMLGAVHLFQEKIDEAGVATLLNIERAHGREVLTASYSKLMKIAQICTKEAEGFQLPVCLVINYFLLYLFWALRNNAVSPKGVTIEALDKCSGKDNSGGLVQTALAKLALVTYLELLVQDQKRANATTVVVEELAGVLANFRNYDCYASRFQRSLAPAQGQQQSASALAESQGKEEDGAPAPAPKLQQLATDQVIEEMRRDLSKVGTACLDLLYDTFAGVHDGALKSMTTTAGGASLISFAKSGSSDFGTGLHELVRLMGMHKQVVSLDGEAAPPPATRQLHRWASEEGAAGAVPSAEIAKERDTVWKQVQQVRRKVANLGVCDFSNQEDLQRFFGKCGSVASFVGKPAEATRPVTTQTHCPCLGHVWSSMVLPCPTVCFVLPCLGFAMSRMRKCCRAFAGSCQMVPCLCTALCVIGVLCRGRTSRRGGGSSCGGGGRARGQRTSVRGAEPGW